MEYIIIIAVIFAIIWIISVTYKAQEVASNEKNTGAQKDSPRPTNNNQIEVPTQKDFVAFGFDVDRNFKNNHLRWFKGYATRIGNGLGRESIAIRDQNHQYAGVIDKANNEYLKSCPNQSCFIWGCDYSVYSLPTIFAYLNADSDDEILLNKMVDNVIEYNRIYRKSFSEYTREEQINIIELLYIIVYYCQKINLPEHYYPEIRRSELTTFSIILEKNKQFELLASLSQYAIILDGGDPKRKSAFLKRTERAAQKVKVNN